MGAKIKSYKYCMNNFCIDIDLGVEPLADPSILKSINQDMYMHVYPAIGMLNPKFIVAMSKFDLVIDHIEIFHSKPNEFTPIHRDVSTLPTDSNNSYDFIKLNYIYGGKNSLMKWYETLPDIKPLNKNIYNNQSSVNVTSDAYRKEDVTVMHEQVVGFPSIVQVGIPHNVQNTDEDRYCLCIVPTKNGKRLSIDTALSLFETYIV